MVGAGSLLPTQTRSARASDDPSTQPGGQPPHREYSPDPHVERALPLRTLELLLLACTLVGVLRAASRWRHQSRLAAVIALATLGVLGAHLLLERPRWQLTTVYVVALVVAGVAVADVLRHREQVRRRSVTVTGLVLVLLGAALAWATPVAKLAEPRGPYLVGTTQAHIVDGTRDEPYESGPRRDRELALQIWYPAAPDAGGEPAPWSPQPRGFAREAADTLGVPAFTLSHLALVRSHAIDDAPPAPGDARPLVVYSHGWTGFRTSQSPLLESLASLGFVVAAVDHTHGSLASAFPDGRVVGREASALPDDAPEEVFDEAAADLVETYADDLAAVLTHLRDGGALDGRVDLSTVAFVGHSTGGAAAILACDREATCEAAVTYDPWVEPLPDEVVGKGLDRPLLSLRSQEWVDGENDARLRRLHAASDEADDGLVAIEGATHRDFTVVPLLSPLVRLLDGGARTGVGSVHRIVDDWTVSFLDHHLRGARLDPLDDPPAHPETVVDR